MKLIVHTYKIKGIAVNVALILSSMGRGIRVTGTSALAISATLL